MLILCVGGTLAYIIAHLQDEARGNASVTSDAVDMLNFEIDKEITLNPNQFNVTEGGNDLTDTAVGSAILRANSTDNNATYNYYVYFQINSNNYIYTTEDQKPEIILTITDPTGSPVTSVNGLTYVESLGGFDITTEIGLYTIADEYLITSNSSTEETVQDWTFTVSFINLDTNQYENGGKELLAEIILSREGYTLANYIIENVYVTDGINYLYHHDGEGEYGTLEAGDNSYRYSGSDYQISDDYKNDYEDKYEDIVQLTCDGVIQSGNNNCGSTDRYYTLSYDSENVQYRYKIEALEQAVNDGYLTKHNVNNYVCFGSNEMICPSDNLYRIIGIFNDSGDYQAKLIKADYVTSEMLGTDTRDYVGSFDNINNIDYSSYYRGNMSQADIIAYHWNADTSIYEYGSNDWTTSELNKINLNTNYLNYLGESWSNMIAYTTWHLGGMEIEPINETAKDFYIAERNNSGYADNPTVSDGKIGLMYVSDFGFAADPSLWINPIISNLENNNWLSLGLNEWTITPGSIPGFIFHLYIGRLAVTLADNVDIGIVNSVRPTFYLKPSVLITSGDGSMDNPYRIEF